MASLKDLSEGRTDIYKVDPRKLVIKQGWNSRDFNNPDNLEHIKMLALSIAELGVKRPLSISMEDGAPYVTDGECRLRATLMAIENGADIKTIPVVNEDRFANEADKLFSQIILNSGKPLNAIEQGRVFKRMVGFGWSQKDIAAKSGISGGRVSQILELQTLPISLQQFIIEGKASAQMVLNVYNRYKQDLDKAFAELTGAVEVAVKQGRSRAMPKDTDNGEGNGKTSDTGGGIGLKKFMKDLVEKAYADERIDDTESMVTISLTESDWAELMEKIDY